MTDLCICEIIVFGLTDKILDTSLNISFGKNLTER